MTLEDMLELLILEQYCKEMLENNTNLSDMGFQGKKLDAHKMFDRCIFLKSEFLKPYVIDTASKED